MGYARLIWFTLAGMIVGYLLIHPFAMLAYSLGPRHTYAPEFGLWGHQIPLSFSPEMLVMGGAFAFMGGIAGLCLGVWFLQRERLMAEKLESERRLASLETLKDLMVTLAHYIRNSNTVIGGFSAHLLEHASAPELQEKFKIIIQASREIDMVINSLQNLTEISTVKYISQGQARIIDLKKELEGRLDANLAAKEQYEP